MTRESQKKAFRAYTERQKLKGIRVRGFRLTDEEWQKVKKFIKKIRGEVMTDLTDQLKLGKLKDGFYYIGNGKITTIAMLKNKDLSFYTWDSCIAKTLSDTSEVLAPVPSYEELQSLEADRLAKNEGEEIVAELKEENARLKELVKECQNYIINTPILEQGSEQKTKEIHEF